MSILDRPLQGPDLERAAQTRDRIDGLTKPVGSLGAIERLAVRLSGIAPLPRHGYARRAVLIGAADHGVTDEGVSAYPSDVTAQMVGAFVGEFAAVNAFARSAGADVYVADFGMRCPAPPAARVFDVRVGAGTANFARGAAMTVTECLMALEAGATAVDRMFSAEPYNLVALGEMGIGNTTSAAALIAVLTNTPPGLVVGRGTGVDDTRYARKVEVVEAACARVAGMSSLEIAAELGGFEIVGLAGALIALAARRVPVLLDGFIVAAAALVAASLAPQALTAAIAAHRSCEPGHAYALRCLGLEPLLDLDLRLGEATGATLAFGLCDAAARMVGEMRTFSEAGVASASSPSMT